jgi:serine/threonine-protein kinase RsbW
LTGRRVQEIYTVGSRIFHETHLTPLLHMQGEVRGIAAEFRTAAGARLDTLVNAVLRRNPTTGSSVVRMTVFDATDRRRYERELLDERRRAERIAARLRVLQEMVARCAFVERADQIVAPILAAGDEAFGATVTTVWLLDAKGSVLTEAGLGVPDPAGRPPREMAVDGSTPEARAVLARDVVLHRSVVQDDPDGRLVTPLVVEERVIGVVSFGFAGVRQFPPDEIELMRTLGRQAGQALERARLHEETARRAWQSSVLARVGRDLDEAVGPADRARRLVTLLVPDIAEYAQVDIIHAEEAGWLAAATPRGGDGRDEVIASGPGGPWPIPAEVRATVQTVTRTGVAAPVPLAAPDGRPAVVLPLWARNLVIGTLLLVGGPMPERLDDTFLLDLADRAGLALDNARLAEQDRKVALTLQRSMLASDWPSDPRFHVVTVYRPALTTLEVGGDWYDAFATSGGRIGVVVGDVVGRGIRAASAMGQLRSAVRALAKARCSPATLLRHMDDFVATLEAGQMTTLAYAELALDTGLLRYACAGHPPPLLLSPGTDPRYLWDGRSGPLGTGAANRSRREAELTVPRGSRLLLYTDGLVERRGERIDQGLGRLADAFGGRPSTPLGALTQEVSDAMLTSEGGHDDMCLLALAFDGAPGFRAEFPASMSELGSIRTELQAWLADCEIDETERFGIVLACSEAVANAIEHGCAGDRAGTVVVTATIDGDTLRLRVSDSGQWRSPRASVDRGRGMALMGRLMDDLVVDRGEGTTVLMSRKLGRAVR